MLMMVSINGMPLNCVAWSHKSHKSHKFSKDLKYEINFFNVKEKVQNKEVKVRAGKMKAKIFLVLFSNARSILELMLCNQKLTKLLFQTLLSSNCRA